MDRVIASPGRFARRARELATFVVIVAVGFGLLRAVHVALPVVSPETHPGPIDVERIEEITHWTPQPVYFPFYRPERLGRQPTRIVVERLPFPLVRIVWRGEATLILDAYEAQAPARPATAEWREPLWTWRDGAWNVARLDRGERGTIELRSDLPPRELGRVAASLRRMEEVR